jgi:serine/threonine protein phosphatase 1
MMWIREEFLYNETSDGLYVVHGHTPIMKKLPQVMPTRCNVDTGCCFGGVLSAAVFDERQYEPYLLFNHQGMKVSR